MNEKKKILITGIIIAAIISLIPITAVVTNMKSQKIIDKFNDYTASEDLRLVYIGRDNCSYCQLFEPEIELISKKYDVDYLYINTNELKNNHFNKLLEDLDVDTEDFGTPYLIITKDGKKVAERAGYLSEDNLFNYLKEQKLIAEDAKLPLNYINYEDYKKIIASNTNELVLLAQSGCEGCIKARPVIYELAEEYNLKINYLNVSLLDEANAESFQTSLEYYKDGISTPTLMIVSNNKVVDAVAGSMTKDKYVDFLKTNSFIK